MNCLEFGQKLGVDPGNIDGQLLSHAEHCEICRAKLQASIAFERRLRNAFDTGAFVEVSAPVEGSRHILPSRLSRRHFWSGAAALAACGTGVYFYTTSTLTQEIISRVTSETLAENQILSPSLVRDVLHSAGVLLLDENMKVTYANNCRIRSSIAAHLVLKTKSGLASAFLMPSVKVEAVSRFENSPWVGRITPFGEGGLAVVGLNHEICDSTVEILKASVTFKTA